MNMMKPKIAICRRNLCLRFHVNQELFGLRDSCHSGACIQGFVHEIFFLVGGSAVSTLWGPQKIKTIEFFEPWGGLSLAPPLAMLTSCCNSIFQHDFNFILFLRIQLSIKIGCNVLHELNTLIKYICNMYEIFF